MADDREKFCARCRTVSLHRLFGVVWRCSVCGDAAACEAIYPGHPDYAELDAAEAASVDEASEARQRLEARQECRCTHTFRRHRASPADRGCMVCACTEFRGDHP